MDATAVLLTILAVIIGFVIQYVIIRSAVASAIRITRDEKSMPAATEVFKPDEDKFFGKDKAS